MNEEATPENFARLYMSMTQEQRDLFWKMFAERIKESSEHQCKSEEREF